jgi:capsular exopolysaccharide synthesis family protein
MARLDSVSKQDVTDSNLARRQRTDADVEFRDYLLLARRQWWIIVISTLLAVAAAALVTRMTTPQYAATIKLFVSSGRTEDQAAVYQGGAFAQQRAKSYADLLKSQRIASAVIRDLGLRTSPHMLQSQVHTEIVPDTVMLKATVIDPVPVRAQQIANALGRELSALVGDLERSSKDSPSPVKVTLVDSADLPREPASPRVIRNLLSALGVGLLLGFGFTVARERLDRSVKSIETLSEITGAPTLGVIGHDPKAGERPLVVHLDSHAPRSEAFRQFRTSLQFIDVGAPAKRIVVTSCKPGEGKSTTVSNLAITLAQAGQRVAVVDADLRRPRLSDYLGIEGAVGLTDVLIGRVDLEEVLQPWGDLPLLVLPSGPIPPNPSELLGSAQMEALLERLSSRTDIVLFDVPPLLPITDAVILARLCDGAVLIARYGSTHREQIRRAVSMLVNVDARLLGTLLNMAPSKGADTYQYSYSTENKPQSVASGRPG